METTAQQEHREAVEAAYSALQQDVEQLTALLVDLEREMSRPEY